MRWFALVFAILTLDCGVRHSQLAKAVQRYRGAGNIGHLTRTYAPGIASEGYELQLPPIPTSVSSHNVFRLDGLPLPDDTAHVELVTYLPKHRGSVPEQDAEAPDISPDNRVHIALLDYQSGQVFAKKEAAIADLDQTHTLRLLPTKFNRNVFDVELKRIPSISHLALVVDYSPGHDNSSPVIVLIIVDARTL